MAHCSRLLGILLLGAALAACAGGGDDRSGSQSRITLGISQDIGSVFGTQTGYMNPLNINR